MFSVYGDDQGRRRKHMSKATVVVSVLAHVAAIGGIAVSARYADAKPVKEVVINEWVLPEEPVEPPPPPTAQRTLVEDSPPAGFARAAAPGAAAAIIGLPVGGRPEPRDSLSLPGHR